MINKSNFKIVVLESPYYNEENEEALQLYNRIFRMKVKGYKKEFGDGVTPFCDADYIGNHLVLCELQNGLLSPIMGMKSVTLERCDYHKVAFPLLSILNGSPHESDLRPKLKEICDIFRDSGNASKLGYNGSYTINPEARTDNELKAFIWDVTTTLLINYYQDYGIENVIAYCSLKYKIDRYKSSLGWEPAKYHGEEIQRVIKLHCLNNTDYNLMTCNKPSELGIKRGEKELQLWNERLTIKNNETIDFFKKEVA